MTRKLTDRDMLARTLLLLEGGPCCGFFACPGPARRPVPMASCAQARAAWDLRRFLERHGGWCPEHGQDLGQCHPPEDRPAALGYSPSHHPGLLCHCAPVKRGPRGEVSCRCCAGNECECGGRKLCLS